MFATIRAKLLAFSFASLLSIVLVGVAGFYGYLIYSGNIADEKGKSELLMSQLRMGSADQAVRADVLQILRLSGSGDTASHEDAQKRLNEQLKVLTDQAANTRSSEVTAPSIRQASAVVRADEEAYVQAAMNIVALAMTNSAAAEAQFGAFDELFNTLTSDRKTLGDLVARERAGASVAAETALLRAREIGIAAFAAALVIISLFAYYVYKGITNPLNQLLRAIDKVNAGAYEVRVNLRTKDELNGISRAFDKLLDDRIATLSQAASENERLNNSVIGLFTAMGALSEKDLTIRAPVTEDIIGTLGDAINQLTDVTATVLHHVTRIAGVVEHASERMKQQSDVVNDMAKEEDVIVVRLISNLETAMASIGEVAIYARDSSRAAAEATESTESAMQTVQATLSGMSLIRETISEMEKRIKRLGERSQEISQIVNLINTISERTHVLSLNAAMQAAMAGEAGRGFAVVAEEVQRLAENSRQATGQIANLVQNIQVETNDTIATVNKTIDQVVKESELAHNAGERMRETHEATARLVRLVATIASSSAEQTKIAESLRSAADEITQFTAKTAEQLEAQNQSAASLVSASKKLMESVSVFKLPPVVV
jgi:methyl-accepting chemotaxis protein